MSTRPCEDASWMGGVGGVVLELAALTGVHAAVEEFPTTPGDANYVSRGKAPRRYRRVQHLVYCRDVWVASRILVLDEWATFFFQHTEYTVRGLAFVQDPQAQQHARLSIVDVGPRQEENTHTRPCPSRGARASHWRCDKQPLLPSRSRAPLYDNIMGRTVAGRAPLYMGRAVA